MYVLCVSVKLCEAQSHHTIDYPDSRARSSAAGICLKLFADNEESSIVLSAVVAPGADWC
jgi:hypothetical protein